jgi:hypothetical protein
MLRAAGARRLTRTLSRCPTGAKSNPGNALCTWDVKHIGLLGTQTPPTCSEGRRQIEPSGTRRYMSQVQIQTTSESVLFLPLSFFTLGYYHLI